MVTRFGLPRLAPPVLLLLVVSLSINATESPAAQGAMDSIRVYSSRIAAERNDRDRAVLVYRLTGAVSQRQIRITTPVEADSLARLLADLLDRDASVHIRTASAEFLAGHAHPRAIGALLKAASNRERGASSVRSNALEALVSLHDRRVLPELLWDLGEARPSTVTFRRIAELGDPAGIEPLRAFASNTNCSDEVRMAARQAERDLRLLLERNIVTPFPLSDSALAAIEDNGFVLLPSSQNEMFELYGNAYPLVTSDVMWHTFMILLRASLDELEELVLRPALTDFSARMLHGSLAQAEWLRDSSLAPLARRNAAIFTVTLMLVTDEPDNFPPLPSSLQTAVSVEISRIRSHNSVASSALFGYPEDFTKYGARGRTQKDLEGYHQAMMYLGRMSWRPHSFDQTRQVLLLLDVIHRQPKARYVWAHTDSLLTLLFGERDDLTISDYERIVARLARARGFSTNTYLAAAADSTFVRDLSNTLLAYHSRIRTATPNRPTGRSGENAGLRMFGQRYTRPVHVLQGLMQDDAWPVSGSQVLDALMTSGYTQAQQPRDRKRLTRDALPDPPDPYTSLSEGWIHVSRSLFASSPSTPAFMRNGAWRQKQANTALGAWAELQHSTNLYTKDANIYKSASSELARFHGYVEPVPDFYDRLGEFTSRLVETFHQEGLFEAIEHDRKARLDQLGSPQRNDDPQRRSERTEASIRLERGMYDEYSSILRSLAVLSRKELRGEPQSIDDGYFLKGLDRRLMYLSFNRSNTNIAHVPMSLVTDVATEYQSRTCLQIAVGRPLVLYAAVPAGGRIVICRGAAYSYYEFVRPISERLEDESWKVISQDAWSNEALPGLRTRGVLRDGDYSSR